MKKMDSKLKEICLTVSPSIFLFTNTVYCTWGCTTHIQNEELQNFHTENRQKQNVDSQNADKTKRQSNAPTTSRHQKAFLTK
jgi:hypothetical protein